MHLHNKKGFTLIELILVIVILGILAVAALPSFIDVTSQAGTASRDGVVGAVRAGIGIYRSNYLANNGGATTASYPATLDSASNGQATPSNLIFSTVIQNGVDDNGWAKSSGTSYVYSKGGISKTFTYASSAGTFQ